MTPVTAKNFIQALKSSLPVLKSGAIPVDLEDTVERVLSGNHKVIDRERFNIILSSFHLPPARNSWFRHYFPNEISDIEEFIVGMRKFTTDALWHFGDLRRGYLELNGVASVSDYIDRHRFNTNDFGSRLDWTVIEEIDPSERGLLGYVSGTRPYRQRDLLNTADRILEELVKRRSDYENLSSREVADKMIERLSGDISEKITAFENEMGLKGLDLFSLAFLKENADLLERTRAEVEATIQRVDELKIIGKRNQLQYLRNVEMIDVYVATSMRDDREYVEMAQFVGEVFKDEVVKSMNLRYFDPTLCYCDSRIDKGIIECLLVRCAKVTIYCAQDGDTFGKDSELAATLCQGKPVIVYVPHGSDSDLERKAKLDRRAETFKQFHPLALQVGLYDGVARGVIVVRSPAQCAVALHKVLSNKLDVEITAEQHGLVLRDKDTNSVLRVMSGWRELSSAFWHNFGLSEDPKTGRPT